VGGIGSRAFTAVCISGEFSMLNISQNSRPMVLLRIYSNQRWHIYGMVHLKVGKVQLLQ